MKVRRRLLVFWPADVPGSFHRAQGIGERPVVPPKVNDPADGPTDTVEPIAAQGTVSRLPTLSDLMITEIMYDPTNGLEDAHAEWIEIQSFTNDPLTLDDCYLTDIPHVDEKQAQADLSGIELAGYGTVLAARSADMNHNGGLLADSIFRFG